LDGLLFTLFEVILLFELRDYQEMLIDGSRIEFQSGKKRICIVSPCGSGKTIIMAWMASQARLKGNNTLFAVHRQELIDQSSKTFNKLNVSHGIVAAKYPMNPSESIQIGSIKTIVNRTNRIQQPQLIILDECFVAGTAVGNTTIEKIKVGDSIPCFDEITKKVCYSVVTNISRKLAPQTLYRLLIDDQTIVCTADHPIFTDNGWKKAKAITKGDEVYVYMPLLRRTQEDKKVAKMPNVLQRGNDRSQSSRCFRKNEKSQSNAGSKCKRKNVSYSQKDTSQAFRSRRKWNRQFSSTTNTIGNVGVASYGVRCPNWGSIRNGVSNKLQDRHCQSRIKNSHRNRRLFSRGLGTEKAGQKENGTIELARVDRVEIFEQGSSDKFTHLCQDGYVYNIEVAKYQTYFANGIAVHNCHHAVANTWRKLLDIYPDAYVIGLTATPQRMGGQGLGDIFDSMIIGPSVKELVAAGNLSTYRYYAPPVAANLEGLKVKYGDYVQSEIAMRMDKSEIIGDLIKKYQELAPGTKAVCYCASIEHSQHTADMFRQSGIPALHIDGETPSITRAAAINEFKTGAIKILCNVDLISEGFDVPAMETVILARPTQSLTLFIQQAMRPMRPNDDNPGKIAKIIDHVGNVYRHGLPDEDREWSLESKKKKPTEKREFPMKICPKCFGVHKPSPVCPYCYHIYQVEQQKEIEQRDGELAEIIELEKKRKKEEVHKAKNVVSLEQIAMQRGYNPNWVVKQCELKRIPFGGTENV
jgi:superfamily II DNA or RNA helicase